MNFQMYKLDLEKAEESDIKLPTSVGYSNKQENSRKTSTSALLIMPKSLTLYLNKLWKILKEMVIPDILECEVKWPLGSITTNKANGSDGIPVELF